MLRCTPLGARSPASYIAVGAAPSPRRVGTPNRRFRHNAAQGANAILTHAGPYFAGAVFPAQIED